ARPAGRFSTLRGRGRVLAGLTLPERGFPGTLSCRGGAPGLPPGTRANPTRNAAKAEAQGTLRGFWGGGCNLLPRFDGVQDRGIDGTRAVSAPARLTRDREGAVEVRAERGAAWGRPADALAG